MEWNEHCHFTDLLAYFERTRTPLTSFIHSSITDLILQMWLLFHFTSLQFLLMCQSTLSARRMIFFETFWWNRGGPRVIRVCNSLFGTDIWPLPFNVMRGTTTTRDYSAKKLKIIRREKEGRKDSWTTDVSLNFIRLLRVVITQRRKRLNSGYNRCALL